MLADENEAIRNTTQIVLDELLQEIKDTNFTSCFGPSQYSNDKGIVHVLVKKCLPEG